VAARLEAALPADPAAAERAWTSWFRDRIHLTAAGNAALAAAVADELLARGLLVPAAGS
jgi:lysophospholipase L1-like esterase